MSCNVLHQCHAGCGIYCKKHNKNQLKRTVFSIIQRNSMEILTVTECQKNMSTPDASHPPQQTLGKLNRKTTNLLKDAILKAAEQAGNQLGNEGLVSYLEAQALKNASSFLTLLGKVLPLQLSGENGAPIKTVTKIELIAMKCPDRDQTSAKPKRKQKNKTSKQKNAQPSDDVKTPD